MFVPSVCMAGCKQIRYIVHSTKKPDQGNHHHQQQQQKQQQQRPIENGTGRRAGLFNLRKQDVVLRNYTFPARADGDESSFFGSCRHIFIFSFWTKSVNKFCTEQPMR